MSNQPTHANGHILDLVLSYGSFTNILFVTDVDICEHKIYRFFTRHSTWHLSFFMWFYFSLKEQRLNLYKLAPLVQKTNK